MARVMIIGAGGVGAVSHALRCPRFSQIFVLRAVPNRNARRLPHSRLVPLRRVRADATMFLSWLHCCVRSPDVVTVALPYQDLHIMEACLEAGVHYVDTANYEPPDVAHFEYSWQWAYHDRFREKGLMAAGSVDPGVTKCLCRGQ